MIIIVFLYAGKINRYVVLLCCRKIAAFWRDQSRQRKCLKPLIRRFGGSKHTWLSALPSVALLECCASGD